MSWAPHADVHSKAVVGVRPPQEEIMLLAGVRPYVTTGVALVGASVIAVTPVEAAPADVRAASSAVQIAAVPSPFELYPQVIARTAENVAALAETYFADPFPIISATIENQLADLADAATALEDGDDSAAFASLVDAILEPLKIPGAFNAAIDDKINMEYGGWALLTFFGSTIAGFMAAGGALADVWSAAVTFDLIGVINAVVNIPARIIDGVVNGVVGVGTGFIPGGLLSHGNVAGPVDVLIGLDQSAGDKLRSSSPDSSADVEEPSSDLSPADQEFPALAVADTTVQAQQEIAETTTADGPAEVPDQADLGLDAVAEEAADAGLAAMVDQADNKIDTGDDALTAVADQVDEELSDALDAAMAETPTGATDVSHGNKVTPGDPLSDTEPATGAPQGTLKPAAGAADDDQTGAIANSTSPSPDAGATAGGVDSAAA